MGKTALPQYVWKYDVTPAHGFLCQAELVVRINAVGVWYWSSDQSDQIADIIDVN